MIDLTHWLADRRPPAEEVLVIVRSRGDVLVSVDGSVHEVPALCFDLDRLLAQAAAADRLPRFPARFLAVFREQQGITERLFEMEMVAPAPAWTLRATVLPALPPIPDV